MDLLMRPVWFILFWVFQLAVWWWIIGAATQLCPTMMLSYQSQEEYSIWHNSNFKYSLSLKRFWLNLKLWRRMSFFTNTQDSWGHILVVFYYNSHFSGSQTPPHLNRDAARCKCCQGLMLFQNCADQLVSSLTALLREAWCDQTGPHRIGRSSHKKHTWGANL